MLRPYQSACLLIAVLGFFFTAKVASAQVESAQPPRQLITQAIDVSKLVTLAGNTRPEAIAANDQGAVAADLPMEHMQLQLLRPISISGLRRNNSDKTSAWRQRTSKSSRPGFSPKALRSM
jgi:guanyl-specific ribonuclease Sa